MDSEGQYGFLEGLPLFQGDDFSQLVIIVDNEAQAKIIREELTGFYLLGRNNYDTPFSSKVIEKTRIVVLKNIEKSVKKFGLLPEYQTIEGLAKKNLLDPIIIHTPLTDKESSDLKQKLESALKHAMSKVSSMKDKGACARMRTVSYDVTNRIIQGLVMNGLAKGPFDGKVVVHFGMFGAQSIEVNRIAGKAYCDEINQTIGDYFKNEEFDD